MEPDVSEGESSAIGIGDPSWEEALAKCPEYGEAYRAAQLSPGEKVLLEGQGRFMLRNGVLLIRINSFWRICVPNSPPIRQRILYQFHDLPTSGHMGTNKTYNALIKVFYWKGIKAYTQMYVETCTKCEASKAVSQKYGGLVQC